MFQCQTCQSNEFQLMLQPGLNASVVFETNDQGELVIQVQNKMFIADLWFMNRFAVCKHCDAIGAWGYAAVTASD